MKLQSLLKVSFNSILLLAITLAPSGLSSVAALGNVAPVAAINSLVTCSNLTFAAPTNYAVPDGPTEVVVGDFNGDGEQDLATANGVQSSVSTLLGNGTGSFSAATDLTAGGSADGLVVIDVNGDNKQDLVTSSTFSDGGGALMTRLGDGAGNFGSLSAFAIGTYPYDAAAGDFNGDGKQDVAFTSLYPNLGSSVGIALGDGVGSFISPARFFPLVVDAFPNDVAVGDFNGDGKQDLVTGNYNITYSISILLGDGMGNLGAPTYLSTGSSASVAVGDFNSDGKQDLAATAAGNTVSIRLGNGIGGFSAPTNFAVGTNPVYITVGDLNGDGKQDLAVVNRNSNNVSILLGNGLGTFSAAMNLTTAGTGPSSLAVGDFNGDGKQDLAVGNDSSGDVAILLNTCQAVPSPSFTDVPLGYWAWSFIERLYNAGITSGCATNPLRYCPEGLVTRAEMAVFLERGLHGASYVPPPVGATTGFGDVPTTHWAAAYIKQLAADGITFGCGNGNYCPEQSVTRAQLAVFLLRSKHGASYVPPAVGASSGFGDVPTNYWAAAFIKQLAVEGITSGCGNGNYCPEAPATRAEMAILLVRAFSLP